MVIGDQFATRWKFEDDYSQTCKNANRWGLPMLFFLFLFPPLNLKL